MSKSDFSELAGLVHYRGIYNDTTAIDKRITELRDKLLAADYKASDEELLQYGADVDWKATRQKAAPIIAARKARRKASIDAHNAALEIYSTWDKGNPESIKAYKAAKIKAQDEGDTETVKYIDDWLARAESFAERDVVMDYTMPDEVSGSVFNNLKKKSIGDQVARDLLKVAGVAAWRTFSDPIGVAIDIAKGNEALAEAMRDYDLKDFGTDAGFTLLTLGIAKGAGPAAKILGRRVAKAAKGTGKKAIAANLAIKGATAAGKAVQKVSKTIAKAEASVYKKAGKYVPDSVLQSLKRTPTQFEERIDNLGSALAKAETAEAKVSLQKLIDFEKRRIGTSGNPLINWAKGTAPRSRPVALEDEYMQAKNFAQQSYTNPLERTDIGDFKYQKELSTPTEGVWFNKKTNTAHVSHRGSVDGYEDWLKADGSIVIGQEKLVERFSRGANKEIQVSEAFPGAMVEGSGHSLGGGIVLQNAETIGTKPWYGPHTTFNGATSPFGKAGIRRAKLSPEVREILNSKITNVRHELDPVSLTPAQYGKNVTYQSTNIRDAANPHSLKVFTLPGNRTQNLTDKVNSGIKKVRDTAASTAAKQKIKDLITAEDEVDNSVFMRDSDKAIDSDVSAVAIDDDTTGAEVVIADVATDDEGEVERIFTAEDYAISEPNKTEEADKAPPMLKYRNTIGSRPEVRDGTAQQTRSGLTKRDLPIISYNRFRTEAGKDEITSDETLTASDMSSEVDTDEVLMDAPQPQQFRIKQDISVDNLNILFGNCIRLCKSAKNPEDLNNDVNLNPVEFDSSRSLVECVVQNQGSILYVAFSGSDTISESIDKAFNPKYGNRSVDGFASVSNLNKLPFTQGSFMPYDIEMEVAGFVVQALAEVYNSVFRAIVDYKNKASQLVITGEGIGGSIASAFSYLYNMDKNNNTITLRKVDHCITFGEIAFLVNNDVYINKFKTATIGSHTRCFNGNDYLSYLPLNVMGDVIGDTYTRQNFVPTGKGFNLTDNISNTNINILLWRIITTGENILNQINITVERLVSPKMLGHLLAAFNILTINYDIAPDMMGREPSLIATATSLINGESVFSSKIATYFSEQGVGLEDQLVISSLCINYLQIATKAFNLDSYEANLNIIRNRQITDKVDIYTPISRFDFTPSRLTQEEIIKRLMDKNIIVGFTESGFATENNYEIISY